MQKKIIIWCAAVMIAGTALAGHITGGEMQYTFVNQSNGGYSYEVTLKLYRRCDGERDFNSSTIVSVFNRGNFIRIMDITVPLALKKTVSLTQFDPCISDPPVVCYEVAYFSFTVTLPGNAEGYVLSSQVIYRVEGISNLKPSYSSVGATYTAEIPGIKTSANSAKNNSAQFTGSDLVLVCARHPFSYSFKAKDADGDQLRYRFCDAFVASPGADANNENPPSAPPYFPVPYGNGFTSLFPLGQDVTIDASTGLITGTAPAVGVYVVTVCVDEMRNGIVIATQRKDIQIKIASCELAAAVLPPEYLLCGNLLTQGFRNLVQNRLIQSQDWEIRNDLNELTFTSSEFSPEYTFADTGTYRVKLVVNRGGACTDSTTSIARVYPGTVAAFASKGTCLQQPIQFIDTSVSPYGTIQSWSWKFQNGTSGDTSELQNPFFQYSSPGGKLVALQVTTSKGCKADVSKLVYVNDKPPLQLLFSDTLICKGDTLALQAQSPGQYQWMPANSLLASNTATPLAFPVKTTTYYASLNDAGCLNTDSVKVRVIDSVDLAVMRDTTICENDAIQLKVISNGLQYAWTPAGLFSDPAVKSPVVRVPFSTSFGVTATIGGCEQSKNIRVTALAYPKVFAGNDTTICYNSDVQLQGFTSAPDFYWTPSQNLLNATSLNPSGTLSQTMQFILTAVDSRGCPRPASDTVNVVVLPEVIAYAGKDTSVVINQTLQLQAQGGTDFAWNPPDYLSRPDIKNPVATFPFPADKFSYSVTVKNQAGCADTVSVAITVFNTLPSIFIPNAFTPNGDGKNDMLRLITAGILNIEYFRIFNRSGQLLFTTANSEMGWNGNFQGEPQPSGVYVWVVQAKDYTGKTYFKKGVITLLR